MLAAGAVVLRRRGGTTQVLLVHRPKYDDWAFPKGKLDPGEAPRTAAVREVLEETGVEIRLGPPLAQQHYVMNGNGSKLVHYWVGRVRGDFDVAAYEPNAEIDAVRWVPLSEARDLLTYARDAVTLEEAVPYARKTHALVVVRHAQARSRRSWKGPDLERTLTRFGQRQADRLPVLLEAYGVERALSSSAVRCWTTLAPFAEASGAKLEVSDELTEEHATADGVAGEVAWALGLNRPVALCSHRPTLPKLFRALGLEPQPLEPAGAVVVHHRKGRIVALERIDPPSGR